MEGNRGNCCMMYNRKRIGNSCVGKVMQYEKSPWGLYLRGLVHF